MTLQHWHPKAKRRPDPTRAARIVATLVLRPGAQGIAPWLAQGVLCDDGKVRVRVTR